MRRSVQDPCAQSGPRRQKAADYLKINPTARIPTLIDPEGPGGKPLTVAVLGDPDAPARSWRSTATAPTSDPRALANSPNRANKVRCRQGDDEDLRRVADTEPQNGERAECERRNRRTS